MREACTLARDMLDLCCEMAQPGVTTDAIDAAVHAAIIEAGACPSPLNYHGFPKVRPLVCGASSRSLGVACFLVVVQRPTCGVLISGYENKKVSLQHWH